MNALRDWVRLYHRSAPINVDEYSILRVIHFDFSELCTTSRLNL